MLIWKNTDTLKGFDDELLFTDSKQKAEIALLGSKHINLMEFPNLKGIFRAGIGRDNIPIKEAKTRGILVRFPSIETIDIIYEETANFTCSLIFRMIYSEVGSINPWIKYNRSQLSNKKLLVIGTGNIGGRVAKKMTSFFKVITFDLLNNTFLELKSLIESANCITLHIPMNDNNIAFFDQEKLSWMKDGTVLINTARGSLVDENAIYQEIKSKRIRAAFDVYWKEPYIGSLKEFHPDYFFMTPHIASTCNEFLKGCRKGMNDLIEELSNA